MAESVKMPALGESVTEGTVTRWLKEVGEEVAVDEPLLEVSTDKVDTEIPSPIAGTLTEILVEEDETVEIGAELARIGDAEDSASSGGSSGGEQQPEPEAPAEQPEPAPAAGSTPAEPADTEPAGSGSSGSGSSGSGDEGVTVTMPALGESVTEGTVTRWLKEVGEDVEVDEPLLEVSTDKVDTEIPSPAAGTLTELFVEEDETVEIGARLARIGGDASGGSGPASSGSSGADASAPESSGSASSGSDAAPVAPEGASEPEVAPEEPQRQSEPEAPSSAPEPAQATEDYNSPASQVDGSVKPPTGEDTGGGAGAPASGTVSAYVTPLVRKLAAENGVDLAALKGTGVGGRIRKQDVLDAAEAAKAPQESAPAASQQPAEPASQQASSQQAPSSSAPSKPSAPSGGASAAPEVAAKRGTTEKMTRLRKVIAQRMVESLQVSAQLTTVVEVDVTRIARLRARAKADFAAREGVGLSFLPFFALASIEALKAFPQVNASIDGDSIVYHAQENLGIAVDTERGLLVPVIKDAGDLNIAGIAKKIADLAARTRDNKVTPDELGGGTFTLTNTGSRGALFDTPIINQPQVAILGTGSVVKRPVVVPDGDGGESIAVRSMIYLALSYDHRLVDGADAARFLSTMKARLEEGAFEGDLGL